MIDELSAYLLEHARRERLALVGVPKIKFETESTLRLGEFGIQARTVKLDEAAGVQQAEPSHTMIYTALPRRAPNAQPPRRPSRAVLLVEGKRLVIGPGGAVIGRSRECDVVLADSNISRRHAEITPSGSGWAIADLGSTNGVRLNGRQVGGTPAARRRRPDRVRDARRDLRGRPLMVLEPISVGLKFGFLAVLYLFLLWVSRSGLKDLRRAPGVRLFADRRAGSRRGDQPALDRRSSRRRSATRGRAGTGPHPRDGVRDRRRSRPRPRRRR